MPRDQAVKNNKELAQKEKIIMPTTFTNRETYFTKLKELIETEARIDELQIEAVAEADISYRFEE